MNLRRASCPRSAHTRLLRCRVLLAACCSRLGQPQGGPSVLDLQRLPTLLGIMIYTVHRTSPRLAVIDNAATANPVVDDALGGSPGASAAAYLEGNALLRYDPVSSPATGPISARCLKWNAFSWTGA